jgi:hypothetical protein
MDRLGAAAARDRARSGDSMSAMRRMAALLAALALVTQVGVVEAMQDVPAKPRPQPLTPSEDAQLAARAARNPRLENFTAGEAEALVYGLVLGAILAFSVFVGHLIACPLGWSHSTQGKTFVPAECLKTNSKTLNYFNGCAVILGFPLYALGYLIGLPFAPPAPPANPVPPPDDRGGNSLKE